MDEWTQGYSAAELDEAQERYGLRFPPDLVALLRARRPVQAYDWRRDDEAIRKALEWPLEGLLFDLEHSDLWLPQWGERPDTMGGRAEVLTDLVHAAPRLIPIFGHRYIPEEPHRAGNPVFSVWQSDVIHYGADLADYIRREFEPGAFPLQPVTGTVRCIPFWSDLVGANGDAAGADRTR